MQLKQDGLINDDNEVLVIAIAHIDPTLFGDVGI